LSLDAHNPYWPFYVGLFALISTLLMTSLLPQTLTMTDKKIKQWEGEAVKP
jgi:hypothetical protein